MRYIVIETFREGPWAVYARAGERGRMLPEGLVFLDSWVDAQRLDRCFQLMETHDESLFEPWIAEWNDLVEFEIVPVVGSPEAARRTGAATGTHERRTATGRPAGRSLKQPDIEPGAALTVRAVRARGVNVPLDPPAQTAAGEMPTAPLVLIDLVTEEGVTGRSYVRCYTATALEPLARLVGNLEQVIAGAPARAEALARRLRGHFRLLGQQGLTGMAMAGINIALWDAVAQAEGVPLVTLLGGEPLAIPAYASLRSMRPREAAAEAELLVARGFSGLKVKVGGGDLSADLETIRAIRSAVGGSVELMADYNQSLSVPDALARIAALDAEGLTWIEEPTGADDLEGHARIAAAARTPIQLGENWWSAREAEESIAARASDYATLDVMRIGGVGEWMHAAGAAERGGLPLSSHAFPEISAHLLCLAPTRHWLEYLDDAGAILTDPIPIEDGRARPASAPGVGLEWKEEVITRLRG